MKILSTSPINTYGTLHMKVHANLTGHYMEETSGHLHAATVILILAGTQSQSGPAGEEKNPCPCHESNLDRPARKQILHWLSYTSS
jgi:hypothetical protein